MLRKQRDLFLKTITILAQAVELRDDYTGGHTQRVTRYATMLAEKLELPDDQIELIRMGGPLHDIGKIGIDDAILRKPGRLTTDEYAQMQKHTTMGAEILQTITEMQPIIPIVRSHHERWDGTGYPDRLAGEEIPLSGADRGGGRRVRRDDVEPAVSREQEGRAAVVGVRRGGTASRASSSTRSAPRLSWPSASRSCGRCSTSCREPRSRNRS